VAIAISGTTALGELGVGLVTSSVRASAEIDKLIDPPKAVYWWRGRDWLAATHPRKSCLLTNTVARNAERGSSVPSVVLKPHASVTGDIQAHSLSIERGAYFDGRSLRPDVTNLHQLEPPASNGQGERVRSAVFKKEDAKTKVARA
jgi:hypothetical protein